MELNNGIFDRMQKYENDLQDIHSVPILIQLASINKPYEIEIYIYIHTHTHTQRHFECIVTPIEWRSFAWTF